MALQDVIVAAAVYEKAAREGLGQLMDFASRQSKDSNETN
jgi:ornithine cyclodeaminase/alanine dehydrogenase-like protein (mu-crystallin family)